MRPERLARLHAAVDRQAAERVEILPYTAGGYVVGAPDATRPVTEIRAIVAAAPKTVRTAGNAARSGHNVELKTTSHTLKFTTSALPYELRSGDRVQLLEQGNVVLKVHHTDPFGTDRTVGHLEPLPPVAGAPS